MLDENMGAAHRDLPSPWPPGRPRCPSVPGRSLDDLYRTQRGEASHRPDEGEVVRGGAEQSRAEQINQMQQLSHTHTHSHTHTYNLNSSKRTTNDTGEKHKHTPKVSDRRCTPKYLKTPKLSSFSRSWRMSWRSS